MAMTTASKLMLDTFAHRPENTSTQSSPTDERKNYGSMATWMPNKSWIGRAVYKQQILRLTLTDGYGDGGNRNIPH